MNPLRGLSVVFTVSVLGLKSAMVLLMGRLKTNAKPQIFQSTCSSVDLTCEQETRFFRASNKTGSPFGEEGGV